MTGSIRTFQSFNSLATSMASLVSQDTNSVRNGLRPGDGHTTPSFDEDDDNEENTGHEVTRL